MKKTLLILFCILTASCSSTTTYNIDEEMADFAKNDVYENDEDDDYEIRERNWHGDRPSASYNTSPSPIDILMKHCNKKVPHNVAAIKAKSVANSQNFTCLKK